MYLNVIGCSAVCLTKSCHLTQANMERFHKPGSAAARRGPAIEYSDFSPTCEKYRQPLRKAYTMEVKGFDNYTAWGLTAGEVRMQQWRFFTDTCGPDTTFCEWCKMTRVTRDFSRESMP